MTNDDLELKRLAEAVHPPGCYPNWWKVEDFDREISASDAAYIAAANPQAILDMLARLEAAWSELDRLRKAHDMMADAVSDLVEAVEEGRP